MRYINLELVRAKITQAWLDRAEIAKVEVRACDEAARSAAINARASVWRDLKDLLEEVSFHKCWYCESIDIRSDNAVDHYRPKAQVAESPTHPGYWWLAFEWDNYRFTCTYCNSLRTNRRTGERGGKQDRFPLWLEENRVWPEEKNLSIEQPMLLDPARRIDPPMLWFDENGEARPRDADEGSYLYERARISIEAYFLNHPRVKDRREVLLNDVKSLMMEAEEFFQRLRVPGDATAEIGFKNSIARLQEQMEAKAPYSAAVRSLLMGFRGTYHSADMALMNL